MFTITKNKATRKFNKLLVMGLFAAAPLAIPAPHAYAHGGGGGSDKHSEQQRSDSEYSGRQSNGSQEREYAGSQQSNSSSNTYQTQQNNYSSSSSSTQYSQNNQSGSNDNYGSQGSGDDHGGYKSGDEHKDYSYKDNEHKDEDKDHNEDCNKTTTHHEYPDVDKSHQVTISNVHIKNVTSIVINNISTVTNITNNITNITNIKNVNISNQGSSFVGRGGGEETNTTTKDVSMFTPQVLAGSTSTPNASVGKGAGRQLVNTGSSALLTTFAGMFVIGTAAGVAILPRRNYSLK